MFISVYSSEQTDHILIASWEYLNPLWIKDESLLKYMMSETYMHALAPPENVILPTSVIK